jgi:hypothetical protein
LKSALSKALQQSTGLLIYRGFLGYGMVKPCPWHVARMERRGTLVGYWWEIQKEKDDEEHQEVDKSIILISGSWRDKMGLYELD